MGKKLYCGNLSYNTTSSDLDQMFAEFGTVKSAEVISDRDTGRSKGFGFVEMNSDQEAQAAIEGLNLRDVEPGIYEMFCLPLLVVGADGAPARVVLRKS